MNQVMPTDRCLPQSQAQRMMMGPLSVRSGLLHAPPEIVEGLVQEQECDSWSRKHFVLDQQENLLLVLNFSDLPGTCLLQQ